MFVRRTIVTIVASVTVLAGLVLSGVPTAHAAPSHPDANAPVKFKKSTLSKGASALVLRAEKVTSHNPSHTLDYRLVKKYLWPDNHQAWGRAFAGGWLSTGYKISHISAAELAKVKSTVKKTAPSPALTPTPMRTCTGEHGVKKFSNDEVWQYLNSCETTDMIGDRSIGSIWIGVFGALIAVADVPSGIMVGIYDAVYATATQNIQNVQNRSDTNSIIIESRDYGINETNGTRYVSWRVVPQ